MKVILEMLFFYFNKVNIKFVEVIKLTKIYLKSLYYSQNHAYNRPSRVYE